MIFHENRLLADDSHETSYLIFFRKFGKMSQNLSSDAVLNVFSFSFSVLLKDKTFYKEQILDNLK